MTDATAESCDSALLSGWVSRYGVPTTITSDLGSQFDSALWQSLMNLLGKDNRTTAYHPQANGVVEQFQRHLKTGLKGRNWVDELHIVLLGIRTTLKEDLSHTSAELVYGTTIRLPGDFFSQPTFGDPSLFVSRRRHAVSTVCSHPVAWIPSYLPSQ